MYETFEVIISTIFLYMTITFLLSLFLQDQSIADIAWGFGFIIIAIIVSVMSGTVYPIQILVLALVLIWGLRLSGYILLRKTDVEDWRYKKWREKWHLFLLRSYFQIFLLQGLLMVLFSFPVIIINSNPITDLPLIVWIGFGIWIIGFLFETIADYQKYEFKKNNKGFITTGLWKYSRHPNYFGEALLWWGIWIISLTVPYGIYGIVGPLLLTFFLLRVSGVPMLEQKYENDKDWNKYAKKTNVVIPWFPK